MKFERVSARMRATAANYDPIWIDKSLKCNFLGFLAKSFLVVFDGFWGSLNFSASMGISSWKFLQSEPGMVIIGPILTWVFSTFVFGFFQVIYLFGDLSIQNGSYPRMGSGFIRSSLYKAHSVLRLIQYGITQGRGDSWGGRGWIT